METLIGVVLTLSTESGLNNLPEYFLTNCDLGDENDSGVLSYSALVVREHERVYLDYQTWLRNIWVEMRIEDESV